MRKKLYTWHRTSALIIAVPVLLWAASGFMHPIMTTIRPAVATQGLIPTAIDSAQIKVPLQQALLQNHIDSFTSFRLIHIENNWFYQVQKEYGKVPFYLGTLNGKMLTAGDWLYAQYLARQFLEGQAKAPSSGSGNSLPVPQPVTMDMPAAGGHDCCDAATDCVLNGKTGTKVSDASLITSFDSEYKSINRLLPVYKVSFEREDGIRVYVSTTQDRFAFAMDNKRRIFDRIFTWVHTWAWLDFLGKGRLVIEIALLLTAFCSTLMGIYIFFTTKSKKTAGSPVAKARRNHRYTSAAIALFTLMFTFSGAFHAFSKFKDDKRDQYFVTPHFAASSVNFSFSQLQQIAKGPLLNINIVMLNNLNYWRINTQQDSDKKQPTQTARRDLMKNTQVPQPAVVFVSCTDTTVLPRGEIKYANFLATQFSGHKETEILSTESVTTFTNEYNFSDKRLPVWKVSYAGNGNERFYVETATGRLSKSINDNDLIEGYSFAFLHKHEFMAWGGKTLKDFSTMFWALAQIAMVTVGLILYFTRRKSRLR